MKRNKKIKNKYDSFKLNLLIMRIQKKDEFINEKKSISQKKSPNKVKYFGKSVEMGNEIYFLLAQVVLSKKYFLILFNALT